LARLLQLERFRRLLEVFAMKKFFWNFPFATVVMFSMLMLSTTMRAQQADQDPAPATPHRAVPATTEQAQPNEAQVPASGQITTKAAQTFSGTVVKENGDIVLKDPVTKVSYKLSDRAKAKRYLGQQVKVTGKLEMSSNTIQVDQIEPLS
jgi:hypothetical protein